MCGALLWVTYGVLIKASPVIVPNVLVFSAAAWTIYRKRPSRGIVKAERRPARAQIPCELPPSGWTNRAAFLRKLLRDIKPSASIRCTRNACSRFWPFDQALACTLYSSRATLEVIGHSIYWRTLLWDCMRIWAAQPPSTPR
jgi:hypothetical protein